MCGIVGKLTGDGRPVDPAVLERTCERLEHRGPDARGIHIGEGIGLGLQRLRIIDLATGDQPIFNEDGSVVVVLNGEIYNYRELREHLCAAGHTFATAGDTEVIPHLYEEAGPACVRALHGMFALAIWDNRRRQIVLARDRVGKKPLFYALHGGPSPQSAFRAVRKLPPASTLVLRDHRATIERYWRLDYERKRTVRDPREVVEELRGHLRRSVRLRMVADVRLGAFLSGGIDSAAVVAAMAEASSRPVRTFTIGFGSADYDELPRARLVAQHFATDHHELVVEPDGVAMLPRIVRHYGEPFADSSAIPSFYVAQLARPHVTVALNGDGGDESFAGYPRYLAQAALARLDGLPRGLRAALRGWVPDAILDGPKRGFRLPIAEWLRTELREYAREVLLDPASLERGSFREAYVRKLLDRHAHRREDCAQGIWTLLCLELWHREVRMRVPVEAPMPASAA
jgi:asparagine synthase (glutamine-hydrolysing)